MKFQKYQECGNDFIILNNLKKNVKNPKKLARLCERAFSIGADGIVLVEKSKKVDYKINVYDPSGSLSNFVHNAAACAAKYIADNLSKKLSDKESKKSIRTSVKKLTLEANSFKIKTQVSKNNVKVEVGKATFEPKKIGLKFKDKILNDKVEIDKKEYLMSCMALNKQPQCVFFVDDLNYILLQEIAPTLEGLRIFGRTKRPNIQAVQILNKKEMIIENWEADYGMVYADTNGAASAFYAAYLAGLVKNKAIAHLVGGKFTLEIDDNELWKTSAVEKVYSGEV